MSGVIRFGVSIDNSLLRKFDELIEAKGYTNRSEAIRDLIRDSMVQAESELGTKEMIGTITIVYNHHTRELTDTLTELQHKYFSKIISTTHIHMDEHNCLEVLIARGRGNVIKQIAELLIGA
ncbi:MAG: nickel-responsive transcriptional regulator NikR, partial [Smithellaceae bacterium]|nr:nickel-responsive transcriptional regulator NikR [Smithellaceae bacterium]